jgi:PKD repeat protein
MIGTTDAWKDSGRPKSRLAGGASRRAALAIALAIASLTVALSGFAGAGRTAPIMAPPGPVGTASAFGVLTPDSSAPHLPALGGGTTFEWLNVSGGIAPSPRAGAAMAYDPKLGASVLFGGNVINPQGGSSSTYLLLSDTWTYQNGVWTNLTSSVGAHPLAREGASFAYDAKDGVLILGGGSGYYRDTPAACATRCGDMWSFNGTAWTQIALPAAYPSPSINPGYLLCAYDSTDGYVVTTDSVNYDQIGPTYAYVGGTWTNLSSYPPFTSGAALVDDPVGHGLLLYGGLTERLRSSGGTVVENETWFFQSGRWSNLTANLTVNPPGVQSEPMIAWDNLTRSILLEAGSYVQLPTPHLTGMSTWQFNGTWTNITSGAQPSATVAAAFAWDSSDASAVMFGGTTSETYPPGYTNATWLYTSTPPIEALSLSAVPDPVDAGATANLVASFSHGTPPFQYAWGFGDGGSSANVSPLHAYATPGTYTVSLNLTDSFGHVASASVALVVVSSPSSQPTASPRPTDVGLLTTFRAGTLGGAGGGTVAWQFGDGSSASGANATHTYASAGNFTVRLWVNDSGGGRISAAFSETVHAALAVTISAAPSTPALGELVNFSANASGGTAPYSYRWSFGDGGTGGDLKSISHIFTTNGPFEATVVVLDGAGGSISGSDNLTVALNVSVLANWQFGAAPLSVSFQSMVHGGVPGYAYRWSFGDGATSPEASPSHTYITPGYYTAIVAVVDRAGNVVDSTWSVLVAPGGGALSAALAVAPATFVIGGSTTVTATVAGGTGGYTLSWSADGLSCGALVLLTQRCTSSVPGSYTIRLHLADSSGAAVEGSATVQVTSSPLGSNLPPGGGSGGPLAGLANALAWAGLGAAVATAALLGAFYLIGRPGRSETPRRDPRYARYGGTEGDAERHGEPPSGASPSSGRPADPPPRERGPPEGGLEDLL